MYLRLLSGKAKKIEKKIKKSSRDLVRALLKPTCKEQKLEKEARNFPSSYKSIKKRSFDESGAQFWQNLVVYLKLAFGEPKKLEKVVGI